jgi:hypothetical protein
MTRGRHSEGTRPEVKEPVQSGAIVREGASSEFAADISPRYLLDVCSFSAPLIPSTPRSISGADAADRYVAALTAMDPTWQAKAAKIAPKIRSKL